MGRRDKRKTYSARGRTDTDVVVDLLFEWHPMWLTETELGLMSPRHIPTRTIRRIIRHHPHIRVDRNHTPARVYWKP